MKYSILKVAAVLVATVHSSAANSQNVFGQIGVTNYYETSALTVDGLIVGNPGVQTTGVGLLVQGGSLNTPTGEVFRTIGHYASSAEQETNWRLFRMQSNGAPREMGRLYAATSTPGGTTNFNFNVQAMADGGALLLRNPNGNGIWISDNAADLLIYIFNSNTNKDQRLA